MTRTVPRAISLETIRKMVPYKSRTRGSDRAGKTRTALLKMRTALLKTRTPKSMRLHVAAEFCSLKMSDESEHTESEFSLRTGSRLGLGRASPSTSVVWGER